MKSISYESGMGIMDAIASIVMEAYADEIARMDFNTAEKFVHDMAGKGFIAMGTAMGIDGVNEPVEDPYPVPDDVDESCYYPWGGGELYEDDTWI